MSGYDLAVVGAGIMGATAALRAREGGMRVVVLERDVAGAGASGVNAGTLSLQIKRVGLMPYALVGHEWWRHAGDAIGFKQTGGYTLAFNQREQAMLEDRMRQKRAAGAPIEFLTPREVREREPALSNRIVAASYCAQDGFADSTRTGTYLRRLLREADVELREHSPVSAIERGFRVTAVGETIEAKRLLIAGGAWTASLAAMLDVTLPIRVRTNTVTVTEPGPVHLHAGIGHATGLLTLKQKPNGSYLIGGDWQGVGSPATGRGRVLAETLLQNLRLARFAVPSVATARVLRSWTGYEAFVADYWPLAGALPGVPNAFVLTCVRGGYTIGPCIGPLVADLILGREPALPLFDPARVNATASPALAAAGR